MTTYEQAKQEGRKAFKAGNNRNPYEWDDAIEGPLNKAWDLGWTAEWDAVEYEAMEAERRRNPRPWQRRLLSQDVIGGDY